MLKLGVVMGFSSLKTVLIFMILPLSSSGKLLQVLNLNTICLQNEVLYECIADQVRILQWDVTQSSSTTTSFTYTYSAFSNTANFTDRIGSSTITAQLIFVNSTIISSVLTVTKVASLRNYTITCNGEIESLSDSIVYSDNSDLQRRYLPTYINITDVSSSSIYITWTLLNTNIYNIRVSSQMGVSNISTGESSVRYNISNSDYYNFTFIACQTASITFTIDRCIFNDPISDQYEVYSDGQVQVTCFNNKSILFNTTCSDGKWNQNMCIETDDGNMTSISVTTNWISTSMVDPNYFFSEQTVKNNITTTMDEVHNYFFIILLSTIIPAGVLISLVIIAIIVVIISYNLRKKKHTDKMNTTANDGDETYEPLNNHHYPQNTYLPQRGMEINNQTYAPLSNHHYPQKFHQEQDPAIKNISGSTYSLLPCGNSNPPAGEIYSTIEDNQSKQIRDMDYAEIKAYNNCKSDKPYSKDLKVKYANILLESCEQDKNLDLHTLMMQLRPISDHYRLFGSVAGISPDSINDIVAKTNSSYDGLTEICELWLKKCHADGIQPTWRAVAEILHLIGCKKLSEMILQVYFTGQLPPPTHLSKGETTQTLPDVCQIFSPASISPEIREEHFHNDEICSSTELSISEDLKQDSNSSDSLKENAKRISQD